LNCNSNVLGTSFTQPVRLNFHAAAAADDDDDADAAAAADDNDNDDEDAVHCAGRAQTQLSMLTSLHCHHRMLFQSLSQV